MTTEASSEPDASPDPGESASNWIFGAVLRFRALAVSAKRAAIAINETRKAQDDLSPELSKGEKLLQSYLEASESISGRLVQMYLDLLESVKSGQTKDQTGFGRLEQLIAQWGGTDAQELLNFLRTLRTGDPSTRSDRGAAGARGVQTSAPNGQATTDLTTAVAQGKMTLGGW